MVKHRMYCINPASRLCVIFSLFVSLPVFTAGAIIKLSTEGEHAYPWFVKFEGNYLCGGSLVWKDIVLTAAHCLKESDPLEVRIGPSTISDGTVVEVSHSIIHPKWQPVRKLNDIAILKLKSSVDNTPVTMNEDDDYPVSSGQPLTTMGFGMVSTEGDVPDNLRVLTMNFVPSSECYERGINNYQEYAHICADFEDGGICFGDSGGPLMDSNNILVGLTSFLKVECASEFPDVFVRVSTYQSWVAEQICEFSSTPPSYCDEVEPTSFMGTLFGAVTTIADFANRVINFLFGRR